MCVCTSGDLLNRPRFQFHASEFDRGGGGRERRRERERERKGPQPVMFPQGGRTKRMEGWKEAGGEEDKVHLPLQRTHLNSRKS